MITDDGCGGRRPLPYRRCGAVRREPKPSATGVCATCRRGGYRSHYDAGVFTVLAVGAARRVWFAEAEPAHRFSCYAFPRVRTAVPGRPAPLSVLVRRFEPGRRLRSWPARSRRIGSPAVRPPASGRGDSACDFRPKVLRPGRNRVRNSLFNGFPPGGRPYHQTYIVYSL